MSKFLDKCNKILKGKNINYKMKFAEKLITERELSSKKGKELLDYIFYAEKPKENEREIPMEEINGLYDLMYMTEFWRNLDQEMEDAEKQEEIINRQTDYLLDCKKSKEMDKKREKWLSKR